MKQTGEVEDLVLQETGECKNFTETPFHGILVLAR